MSAPASLPLDMKCIRMNLPNREELSFRTVFALPKDSKTGLVWTTCSSKFAFFASVLLHNVSFWNVFVRKNYIHEIIDFYSQVLYKRYNYTY